MRTFKKILLVVIVFGAAMLMTGCGAKNVEGTLDEVMTKLYENIPDDKRPMMLENIEVNDENIEYYLGTKDIEYEEALASEPGIGSIAHSVVLVRVKEGADVEKVKEAIKKNVNPAKWICVSVPKEDVIVENIGDLVVLIMVSDDESRDTIKASFDKLA